MTHVASTSDSTDVRSAIRSTHLVFAGAGFVFASWLSRIPQIKEQLGLDPSALGLVLLTGAAGSIVGLLLAGPAATRFGSRHTVAASSFVSGVGFLTIAVGYGFGVAPVVVGLFVFGFGQGGWDVSMNMQGAVVEHRSGRALLSRFHAVYSIGTVAGGLVGAAVIALRVPLAAHLALVGVGVATVVGFAVRGFVPNPPAAETTAAPLRAWRERRTLLIGLVILAFAFAEGTGNDWISVALVDDYRATPAVGTLGVVAFLTAITVGRWSGPILVERYGRVRSVRVLGIVSVAGVGLFAADLATPLAVVGALMWGAGVSLGFPVGLSAAADDPAMAAARVSVCSSIAFTAFLAGPSLIGFLGHEVTVVRAVAGVAALLVVAVLLTGVIRPLPKPASTDHSTGPSGAADSPEPRVSDSPEPRHQGEIHS